MKKRLIVGACALLTVTAYHGALAEGVFANGPSVTVSDMLVFPAGPAVAGVSILSRDELGVEATVSTTGLVPGGAYSWWWVIFNEPRYCRNGCGLDDLPPGTAPPAVGDLRVQASLLWGGGFVADGTGSAYAIARLDRGEAPGEVVFGPELRNVGGADIHIVLRSHGPAVAGQVATQVGSFNGGCPPAACTNVQAAVHTSQQ